MTSIATSEDTELLIRFIRNLAKRKEIDLSKSVEELISYRRSFSPDQASYHLIDGVRIFLQALLENQAQRPETDISEADAYLVFTNINNLRRFLSVLEKPNSPKYEQLWNQLSNESNSISKNCISLPWNYQ